MSLYFQLSQSQHLLVQDKHRNAGSHMQCAKHHTTARMTPVAMTAATKIAECWKGQELGATQTPTQKLPTPAPHDPQSGPIGKVTQKAGENVLARKNAFA